MKIKKTIANITTVLLSVFFLVLVFLLFKQKETSFLNKQREYLFKNQILEIVLKTNIRYEGVKFNDLVLLDRKNQSFKLSSKLDTSPRLFLYAPLQGCDKCIEDIYPVIKKYTSIDKNQLKVYLLVKSPNFRSFLANQPDEKSNIEAYYIKEGVLGLDIENLDTPFLFLADQSFKIECFFLIDKNIPDINEYYLKKIFYTF